MIRDAMLIFAAIIFVGFLLTTLAGKAGMR